MASILRMLRSTLKRGMKRGANVVRRVGKATRRTVKRGTNAVGLTRRRRSGRRRSNRNRD